MTTAEGVADVQGGSRTELGHRPGPGTGRTIFAVARIAGGAAHSTEGLTERPLRFRARAVYSV